MDRKKVLLVVKGYFWKDKKNTILTVIFLCFITISLLVGNQLFENVQMANRLNAEALEGKHHVAYYSITKEQYEQIKAYPAVLEAGISFSLGQSEDGTAFGYIDEGFRNLGAVVADKNIKQVIEGHWAETEHEVVLSNNYMKKNSLKLGDQILVDLTSTDSDTGDILFQLPNLSLTVCGVIDNDAGFTDRKIGYVSKEFAYRIMEEYGGNVNVVARFKNQNNITREIQNLNAYLGYEGDKLETLEVRKNFMIADAVEDNGNLRKQQKVMNIMIWLVCVMVLYNIFYNRFFEKKRDFMNLRKLGFQTWDLYKIAGSEFFILLMLGVIAGILLSYWINRIIYSGLMQIFIHTYDAKNFTSSELTISGIQNAACMLLLVIVPSIATMAVQLKATVPVEIMRNKRKNYKKILISIIIVSILSILISILGVQDNQSDAGIMYVKDYVPGDLQLTVGSIFENIFGENIPGISEQTMRTVREMPGVTQTQNYDINYGKDLFLCQEKYKLNKDGGFFSSMEEMEQDIDGKRQCLYTVMLVTTDNIQAIVPSYHKGDKKEHVAIMEGELAHTLNLKPGDIFTLYDEKLIKNASKKGCTSVEVKLLDTQNIVLSENHLGGNLLIVDSETAEAFSGKWFTQIMNIWVEEGKEAIVSANIKRMAEYDSLSFHSAKEQMQGYVDSDHRQKTLQIFFIVLLACIGIFTHYNTLYANLLNQRKDFILMHKIGIRKDEMYFRVIKEGAWHGISALAFVAAAQIFLCLRRHIEFGSLFLTIDAVIVISCMLFPAVIVYIIFRRQF